MCSAGTVIQTRSVSVDHWNVLYSVSTLTSPLVTQTADECIGLKFDTNCDSLYIILKELNCLGLCIYTTGYISPTPHVRGVCNLF
jgi:hypothetical protein